MFFKSRKTARQSSTGLLTFSESEAAITPMSNLLRIISSLSGSTCLIAGRVGYARFSGREDVRAYGIMHSGRPGKIITALNYMLRQLQISYRLVRLSGKTDRWILFFNADTLILPVIVLKLLRKNVILLLPSSTVKIHQYTNTHNLKAVQFLTRSCHYLSDRILLYSPNMVAEWDMGKYQRKIRFAHEHIVDLDEFAVRAAYGGRKNIVAYVGRLSEEKGILNFVRAIPLLLAARGDLEFVIAGDGHLAGAVQEFIAARHLEAKVSLAGWIPHDTLPELYNKAKLLVIPSYTEGLPNTMLEAMACGTPVIASSVGSIPDIIADGRNGFILEGNSPDKIASGILKSFGEDLEKISHNARRSMEAEFSFEATVRTFAMALQT